MTYGVDQCIRCGKPIRNRRDTHGLHDNKPSKMSEAEWRAAGFLGRPTMVQEHRPGIGCCADCTEKLINKNWRPRERIVLVFVIATIFVVGTVYLLTIYMQ